MIALGTVFLIVSYHLCVHMENWHGSILGVVGMVLLIMSDNNQRGGG
jgi:hypothetical protein